MNIKHLICSTILCFLFFISKAQNKDWIAAYAGPSIWITSINKQAQIGSNVEAGISVKNMLFLGYYTQNLSGRVNNQILFPEISGKTMPLNYRHQGLHLGYLANLENGISIGLGAKIGAGTLLIWNDNLEQKFKKIESQQNFTSISPQLEANIEPIDWARFHLAAGYQFINGLNNLHNESLNRNISISLGLQLRFF